MKNINTIWQLAAVLALLGGLISLYLLFTNLGYSNLICPISGCDQVQASPYSKILGIPVAAYGLGLFLGLLSLSIYGLITPNARIANLVFTSSSLGVLAYLRFTYLEAFVIQAWCFWCVLSSLMMLGIWLCCIQAYQLQVKTVW
jgi:uncharacterized membrane protein